MKCDDPLLAKRVIIALAWCTGMTRHVSGNGTLMMKVMVMRMRMMAMVG